VALSFSDLHVCLIIWSLQKFSPLHKAVEMKGPESLEITNILLQANANLRQLNDAKQSALHLAALTGLSCGHCKIWLYI
jgi:hypothetical protein